MKRICSILLLMALTVTAWADSFENGDFAYEITTAATSSANGVVTCTGLSTAGASATSLTIPYIVTNGNYKYYVTAIGEGAFKNNKTITGVTIKYGIQDIKSQAFYGCNSMTTVQIPSSVTYLRAQAFVACNNLTRVFWAALDPTKIISTTGAFTTSTNRTLYVPWGADLDAYRNRAAFGSSYISSIKHSSNAYDYSFTNGGNVVVSKAPTSSANGEFTIIGFVKTSNSTDASNGIYKLTGSNSKPGSHDKVFTITAVSDSAFAGNTNLVQLDLSGATSITTFGQSAARGCTNLTSVTLATADVGKWAFRGCTALTSFTTSGGILADYAFYNCTALTNLSIEGVTRIKYGCFWGCTALTSLYIPASVTSIEYAGIIPGCTGIKSITVDAANANYSSYDGALYNKAQTLLLCVPEGYSDTYVDFPKNLTEIAQSAFGNCKNIKSIDLPYGVKTIKNHAFVGCSLDRVSIPSSVTSVGNYLFQDCSKVTDLYVNTNYAPSIDKSTVFNNGTSSVNLHTQRGMVTAFKNAGWTDFASYNNDDVVASDYRTTNGFSYTVTSTVPLTINGTEYTGGRVKMVRGYNAASVTGSITVPARVTINSKTYAVTCVDSLAFSTSNSFSLAGCENVDTVGYHAFYNQPITSIALPRVSIIDEGAFAGCTQLTAANWGNRLTRVNKFAFEGATAYTKDIILPVGLEYIGDRAFSGVQSTTILVPGTALTLNQKCFYNMSKLSSLIFNIDFNGRFFSSSSTWDFTNVPTSCAVYVPVGRAAAAKVHTNWKRFTSIQEGAYDFAYMANLYSMYKMTVTSTTPVTVDGVTYDGTAKYVYTPLIKEANEYEFDNYETDKMCGSEKKYLMTEIGDSCFVGSTITDFNFTNMTQLARIGKKAFYGTKITSAEMPDNRIAFGVDAFYGATNLTEIITKSAGLSWEGRFFGNNATNFNLYADNKYIYYLVNKSTLKNHEFNSSYKCNERVAPCFTATATTKAMAVWSNLYIPSSNLPAKPVYINKYGYKSETQTVSTTNRLNYGFADYGMMLTDLVPGTFYKIPRYYGELQTSVNNCLQPVGEDTNIFTVGNAYYWDTENLRFVKPTSAWTVPAGDAYLNTNVLINVDSDVVYIDLFPKSAVKGDLNGDGIVDITDVNMAINMVLGKVAKTNAGDIDGSGDVDITDVNAIINLMLGK